MNIAIIGDGAATVLMLSNLSQNREFKKIKKISLYTSAHVVGPGMAYQWDIVSPLMNIPNYSVTVDPINSSSYVHWLNDNHYGMQSKPLEYSSRRIFETI
ncbi:FAD/NAD(P)-binding protein [Xenorhabdus doucetiae]|uniref:FAD-NAD(P)-binding protein n=1 Tax=Xenorhabdus doucetiae TaxID=351671 RepID=A0A068R051_9GAMM|nr:FAD/NAD(P)-binding protein [Xenorhabdus doucetiae]TYP04724.1 FAD-NAD(P)-binding protein [Xenorhabdus doucetiae]CDG19470.1 protein of unknown function [Xenorhabdus doucetiae]